MDSGQGLDASLISPPNVISCNEQPLGSELGPGVWEWGGLQSSRGLAFTSHSPDLHRSGKPGPSLFRPHSLSHQGQRAGRSELPQPQLPVPWLSELKRSEVK